VVVTLRHLSLVKTLFLLIFLFSFVNAEARNALLLYKVSNRFDTDGIETFDCKTNKACGVTMFRSAGSDRRLPGNFAAVLDGNRNNNSTDSLPVVTTEPNNRVLTFAFGVGTDFTFSESTERFAQSITGTNLRLEIAEKEALTLGQSTTVETVTSDQTGELSMIVAALSPGTSGNVPPISISDYSSAESLTGGVITMPESPNTSNGNVVFAIIWTDCFQKPSIPPDYYELAYVNIIEEPPLAPRPYPAELTLIGETDLTLASYENFGTSADSTISNMSELQSRYRTRYMSGFDSDATLRTRLQRYTDDPANYVFTENSLDLTATVDPVIDSVTRLTDHFELTYETANIATLPAVGQIVTSSNPDPESPTNADPGSATVLKTQAIDDTQGSIFLENVTGLFERDDVVTSGAWNAIAEDDLASGGLIYSGLIRDKENYRYYFSKVLIQTSPVKGSFTADWSFVHQNNYTGIGGGLSKSEFDHFEFVDGDTFNNTTEQVFVAFHESNNQPEGLRLFDMLFRTSQSVQGWQDITYSSGSGVVPDLTWGQEFGAQLDEAGAGTAIGRSLEILSGGATSGTIRVTVTSEQTFQAGDVFEYNPDGGAVEWTATIDSITPPIDFADAPHFSAARQRPSELKFYDVTYDAGSGALPVNSDNNPGRPFTTPNGTYIYSDTVSGDINSGTFKLLLVEGTLNDNDVLSNDSFTVTINGTPVQDPTELDEYFWIFDEKYVLAHGIQAHVRDNGLPSSVSHLITNYAVGGSGGFSGPPDSLPPFQDGSAKMSVYSKEIWQ